MFEGITKNWKTSSFGVLLILLGFYLLHEHNEQIETAIGLIIGGLSQLFAKDGATKSEYIKEKEEIKNEIIRESERKVNRLTVDELRDELDKRARN